MLERYLIERYMVKKKKKRAEERREPKNVWAGTEVASGERKTSSWAASVCADSRFSVLEWMAGRKCWTDEMTRGAVTWDRAGLPNGARWLPSFPGVRAQTLLPEIC